MRVLLTTKDFPAHRHSFIENHALALTTLGVDVCVVSSADGDHRLQSTFPGTLELVRALSGDRRGRKLRTLVAALGLAARENPSGVLQLVASIRRRTGLNRSLLRQLHRLAPILSSRADVVHLGWVGAAADWTEVLHAVDAPIVVSCHGSDLRIKPLLGGEYPQKLRKVFDRADLVHCVSPDLAQRAVALGLKPSKLFVGTWGVDASYFRPAPDAARPNAATLRVVSVGRLNWVKGYHFALQAMHEARRAGLEVSYTILGDGTDDGRLELLTAVRDLGLEGCVSMPGFQSRTELLASLQSSDVFLLPSLSEGVSTATLEAMAAGLPVVVTDVGGMREIVTAGVDGLVVPARDPTAIANGLAELASDPALRRQMGEQGRRRAVAEFDVHLRTKEMLEQYRRLTESPH